MTLQDSTFHLPRGKAGDFNPFTAKSFRMVEAPRLELRFNAYQAFVLTFELNFLMVEAAGIEPALPGWPVSVNLPKLAPENGRDYRTRTCIALFGAIRCFTR